MEQDKWNALVSNDAGTKQARRALGAEIVLELDTSITLDQYEGSASRELVAALATFGGVENDAWKVAFMSCMELCQLAHEFECSDTVGDIVDLIRWCRRAVGLSEEFATGQWGEFQTCLSE